MKQTEKFAKKTLIYTIGSFGSKFLSFLLVPYYTYLIPSYDMGKYDIILTTIYLLTPIITFQTQEVIITGIIRKQNYKNEIIKSVILIVIINSFLFLLGYLIIQNKIEIEYGIYLFVILGLKSIYCTIQQCVRGLSNTKVYTISGILYTFIFLMFNIVQLSVFNTGIKGLFVSDIIACIIVILYILISEKGIFIAFHSKVDLEIIKWIIKFSLPLIPNAVGWWVINASDRYVINIFLGNSANGIYAISYKFANLIQIVTSLFYLSWQEVSLEEYDNANSNNFTENMVNVYARFLLCSCAIGICLTPFIVVNFMGNDYLQSWRYVPWLYLGVAFNAIASFLNTSFLATGKTNKILKSTIIAAIVNLIIDVACIKFIGLYAASLSTLIASFVLFLQRVTQSEKLYGIKINCKDIFLLSILNIIISIVILLFENNVLLILLFMLTLIVFLIYNRNIIIKVFLKIKCKLY